jgi:hypothetical protein
VPEFAAGRVVVDDEDVPTEVLVLVLVAVDVVVELVVVEEVDEEPLGCAGAGISTTMPVRGRCGVVTAAAPPKEMRSTAIAITIRATTMRAIPTSGRSRAWPPGAVRGGVLTAVASPTSRQLWVPLRSSRSSRS